MIILTGCAGFVGSNIAKRLHDKRISFYGIDDLSFGDLNNVPKEVAFQKISFQDLFSYVNYEYFNLEGDILVHCATSNIIYAIDHPIETFKNNAEHTIELFKRWKGKIIYTSTSSVYSQAKEIPTKESEPICTYNAYDTSKRIAELYLQKRGNYTTLRLSNVYGTNQRASNPYCGVIGKYLRLAIDDKPLIVYGTGLATRDYTYIEDVVDAVMLAIDQEPKNTEINIGTGRETSVMDLVYTIKGALGKELNIETIKPRIIDSINRRCLNIEKADELLKWKPKIELKEGIKKTIEWMTK